MDAGSSHSFMHEEMAKNWSKHPTNKQMDYYGTATPLVSDDAT